MSLLHARVPQRTPRTASSTWLERREKKASTRANHDEAGEQRDKPSIGSGSGHDFARVRAGNHIPAPRSGGRSLPDPVREKMERAFSADFSQVRIHQDRDLEAFGAKASTSGDHLHFAGGMFKPFSAKGQQLIGHELAHVVQQRNGRLRTTRRYLATRINNDPALEAVADASGTRAARGESVALGAVGGRGSVEPHTASESGVGGRDPGNSAVAGGPAPLQLQGTKFNWQNQDFDLSDPAHVENLAAKASPGLMKALNSQIKQLPAGGEQRIFKNTHAKVVTKLKAPRSQRNIRPAPYFKPGKSAFVANEQFGKGRGGASALKITRQETGKIVNQQLSEPPTNLSEEENKYFDQLADIRKNQGGQNFVKSTQDENGRTTGTWGVFDPNTARTGRDATPEAKGMEIDDERGHGFPQSGVIEPSAADKAIHMTAENWLANQGTTREIENAGQQLAKDNPDREVFKHRTPIYENKNDSRPVGYKERLVQRSESGAHFQEKASIIQTNPKMKRSGSVIETPPTKKALKEMLKKQQEN